MQFQFELEDDAIHLWAIPIESPRSIVAQFYTLLSSEERTRAARFQFEYLEQSFILARGVLRVLLGRYLSVQPRSIQFLYGPKGKPALAEAGWLRFNMSHSGRFALLGFAKDCEIGVDIERIRPLSDFHEIANQFFSPEEASELISLPVDQHERAFYLCWTRKEAYIKAIGDGLAVPLSSFRVTLDPSKPARFVHLNQDRTVAASWTLTDVKLFDPYVAAIAYRKMECPFRLTCLTELTGLIDF
ncbi:MAG TPA: 4'-phosphopantetheinyl transferase superfamily protein [Edaphobacter sp.]|nr:4'-phosphopantetheinyl transferase superfamily protein [Edaphobacter sp.]